MQIILHFSADLSRGYAEVSAKEKAAQLQEGATASSLNRFAPLLFPRNQPPATPRNRSFSEARPIDPHRGRISSQTNSAAAISWGLAAGNFLPSANV
jgi:hypothetical protein